MLDSAYSIRKKQNGLTLIELVVSIVVLSIIVMVVSQYIESSVESYRKTKNNVSALSKLRLLDERLSKEIRRTRYTAAFDIATFTSTSYEFTDVDGISVTYSYSGNTLSIDYDNPVVSSPISNQLTAFTFNYYQADGITAAGSIADIKFVEWVMTLSENGVNYSLTNRVMLRGVL